MVFVQHSRWPEERWRRRFLPSIGEFEVRLHLSPGNFLFLIFPAQALLPIEVSEVDVHNSFPDFRNLRGNGNIRISDHRRVYGDSLIISRIVCTCGVGVRSLYSCPVHLLRSIYSFASPGIDQGSCVGQVEKYPSSGINAAKGTARKKDRERHKFGFFSHMQELGSIIGKSDQPAENLFALLSG